MVVPYGHFLKLSSWFRKNPQGSCKIHSLVSIPQLHPGIGNCIRWEFDIVCLDLRTRPNSLTRKHLGKWFQLSLKRRWKGPNSQNSQFHASLKAWRIISRTGWSNLLNQDPNCTPGIFSMRRYTMGSPDTRPPSPCFSFLTSRSLRADLQFLSVNVT